MSTVARATRDSCRQSPFSAKRLAIEIRLHWIETSTCLSESLVSIILVAERKTEMFTCWLAPSLILLGSFWKPKPRSRSLIRKGAQNWSCFSVCWAVKMLNSLYDVIYLNSLRVIHSRAFIKLRIRRHYIYFVPVVMYQACKSLVLNIHYFWWVSLPFKNSDRTRRHSLLRC